MALMIDERAGRLLERCRPGQGILITVVGNYGLPGELLTVERCTAAQVARDPDVVLLETRLGVPIFVYRRVAAYARWQPLRLTAQRWGWWTIFAITGVDEIRRDLTRWERSHPGLCAHLPAA